MADKSAIEWTDATWNPITGCSVVSPGCTHCYAMGLAGGRLQHHPSREGLTTQSKAGPVWNGQVRFNEQWLDQPLQWKRPRMIFVCAHGDLFHEKVPDEWIDRVFAVMALAPQHTFQVLTKRAVWMHAYMAGADLRQRIAAAAGRLVEDGDNAADAVANMAWPFPNVWLGISAEDQPRFNERWPALAATPAAVRFVSYEPALGPLDLTHAVGEVWPDWIIAGGESGPRARPAHPDWFRDLRDECAVAGVPFFFKQWGEYCEVDDGVDRGGAHALIDVGSDKALECLSLAQKPSWITPAGRHLHSLDSLPPDTPCRLIDHIGKKIAGRLLDGIEHNGMPAREV